MAEAKTIEVTTEELGIVTVHKLHLGDYAELLKSLRKIPADIMKMVQGKDSGELKKLDVGQLIEYVPQLMETAPDEFMHLMALCSDKSEQEIKEKLDLTDALEIFDAALQLNDYRKVVATIKKLQGRLATKAPETPPAPN